MKVQTNKVENVLHYFLVGYLSRFGSYELKIRYVHGNRNSDAAHTKAARVKFQFANCQVGKNIVNKTEF